MTSTTSPRSPFQPALQRDDLPHTSWLSARSVAEYLLAPALGLATFGACLFAGFAAILGLLFAGLVTFILHVRFAALAENRRQAFGEESLTRQVRSFYVSLLLWYGLIPLSIIALEIVLRIAGLYLPYIPSLLAVGATYKLAEGRVPWYRPGSCRTVVRGIQLMPYKDVRHISEAMCDRDPEAVPFGGTLVPSAKCAHHFAIAGVTGSGKTLTFRVMMESILPRLGQSAHQRAVIFDAKNEVLPLLAGMGLSTQTFVTNPFDARGYAWDMGRDITRPSEAKEIAEVFIPNVDRGDNQFWDDAARGILAATMEAFIHSAGEQWSFRDVILSVKNLHRIKTVLCSRPETAGYVETYLTEQKLLHNIAATFDSKINPFKTIAAYWHRAEQAGRTISLRDWANSSSILVFSVHDVLEAQMRTLNRVLFKRLSQLLLIKPDQPEVRDRTWVFLDELQAAGRLHGLEELLTRGRSKGICMVLGFEDSDRFQGSDLYGKEQTQSLLGQCQNRAYFRLETPQSKQWASDSIGSCDEYETLHNSSQSSGPQGRSTNDGDNTRRQEQKAVMPAEFRSLRTPTPQTGMEGYFSIGLDRTYDYYARFHVRLSQPAPIPSFMPLDIGPKELLPDWTAEDLKRLGLPPETIAPSRIVRSYQQSRQTVPNPESQTAPAKPPKRSQARPFKPYFKRFD